MTEKTATVLGATGFVGVNLVTKLTEEGWHIRAITRHKSRHKDLMVLPNVTVIEADPHDPAQLTEHCQGSDAVINLVGILNQSGNTTHTFRAAHVSLVENVVQACLDASVPRYLHMSALHANAEAGTSEYLRTKGEGERIAFDKSGDKVAVTAFRPSVIFGPGDGMFNRFAGLLKIMPVFPLACPDAKMAPVYIGDVCDAMVNALEDESTIGQSLDLVGPQDYTLYELVEYTATVCGLKRMIIRLPDWAARLQAQVMQRVPGKPFTMDNYGSLQTDSISADPKAKQPTAIEAIVPGYLGDKNRNAQYQYFRRNARRD
ncbi:MAG TPA: complex I NDUFA9 subunit family protein [Gammaproteobacteria bacterium]|jgi:NADH dehydrogenase|nr:complex I NDUFA9 subunit family protein [Gammaproteobacteria bacterium]